MAPTSSAKSHTKPLKPYRRGETLGKASRAGKATTKPRVKPAAVAEVKPVELEDEDEELEVGSEGDDGAEAEEFGDDEGDEDASPGPAAPVRRKKKGKKFVESRDDLMSMVAAITSECETAKKSKIAKQKPFKKPAKVIPAKPKDRSKEADAMKKQRLEVAKVAVVSAQARARKEQKEVVEKATVRVAAKDDDSSRKRVSFA